MATSVADLQARFGIPHLIRFEADPRGLTRAVINSPLADAKVYLLGAHVTHFEPRGQPPVLFLSEQSAFEVGKPIRGGIPVIFPWFGPRAGDASAPMHGFARLQEWEVESTAKSGDDVTLVFRLEASGNTRAMWPFGFTLRYTVTVGRELAVALEVRNTDAKPIKFEEALHTYFALADVREASVEGLADVDYVDKADKMKRKLQGGEPIRITGETDRVYLATRTTCTIHDPGNDRRITVAKEKSDATVVWNPWTAKAKAMADFGDDEWPRMICVETCNVADHAVTLAPGTSHEMKARIGVKAG